MLLIEESPTKRVVGRKLCSGPMVWIHLDPPFRYDGPCLVCRSIPYQTEVYFLSVSEKTLYLPVVLEDHWEVFVSQRKSDVSNTNSRTFPWSSRLYDTRFVTHTHYIHLVDLFCPGFVVLNVVILATYVPTRSEWDRNQKH